MNPSLTLKQIGEIYFGGKKAKAAKREVLASGIPFHLDHAGHMLIKQSDMEAWRESRMQQPAAPSLKFLLKSIAEKTRKSA